MQKCYLCNNEILVGGECNNDFHKGLCFRGFWETMAIIHVSSDCGFTFNFKTSRFMKGEKFFPRPGEFFHSEHKRENSTYDEFFQFANKYFKDTFLFDNLLFQ